MIKITSDLDEFWEREYGSNNNNSNPIFFNSYNSAWFKHYHDNKGFFGLYLGNTIWYRQRSKPFSEVITILHEIGHLIVSKCFSDKYATLELFSGFLDGVLDFVNGVLCYKGWRIEIHEAFQVHVVTNFRDWIELGT